MPHSYGSNLKDDTPTKDELRSALQDAEAKLEKMESMNADLHRAVKEHAASVFARDNTRLRASLAEAKEALLESEIAHDEESDCWNNIHRADRASLAAAEELARAVRKLEGFSTPGWRGYMKDALDAKDAFLATLPKQGSEEVCPDCGGAGINQNRFMGEGETRGPCPTCGGIGKSMETEEDDEQD